MLITGLGVVCMFDIHIPKVINGRRIRYKHKHMHNTFGNPTYIAKVPPYSIYHWLANKYGETLDISASINSPDTHTVDYELSRMLNFALTVPSAQKLPPQTESCISSFPPDMTLHHDRRTHRAHSQP